MAFNPVDRPHGRTSNKLGVSASIKEVTGPVSLFNVIITITESAQTQFFGGPISDEDRFSILRGEGPERGQVMIRKDSIGEFRFTSGIRGSRKVFMAAWPGCPTEKSKAEPCELVQAEKNKLVIRLPFAFPPFKPQTLNE